jgi:hypothetical protein
MESPNDPEEGMVTVGFAPSEDSRLHTAPGGGARRTFGRRAQAIAAVIVVCVVIVVVSLTMVAARHRHGGDGEEPLPKS